MNKERNNEMLKEILERNIGTKYSDDIKYLYKRGLDTIVQIKTGMESTFKEYEVKKVKIMSIPGSNVTADVVVLSNWNEMAITQLECISEVREVKKVIATRDHRGQISGSRTYWETVYKRDLMAER